MKQSLGVFHSIFNTTRTAIEEFMSMLTPVIQQAKDDHERLYYHHIYEEEEHRLSRLAELIPLIEQFEQQSEQAYSFMNRDFNRLLQELNLEKFGLHNFVEHLDLAMFSFTDEDRYRALKKMRDTSYQDYQRVKSMLEEINNHFDTGYTDPHAHHDHDHDHLEHPGNIQGSTHTGSTNNTQGKKLTVGSLLHFK